MHRFLRFIVTGTAFQINLDTIIPNKRVSIPNGAIIPIISTGNTYLMHELKNLFKQYNKTSMKNNSITSDDFKKYIMTKLSSDNYTMKSKSSSIIINNHKLKTSLSETSLNVSIIKIIENDCNEIDNKIINDYQNTTDDINQIGLNNEIDVYKVISILMNHKIISKQTDARGYEIYKKSGTCQNKIKCNLKSNLKSNLKK